MRADRTRKTKARKWYIGKDAECTFPECGGEFAFFIPGRLPGLNEIIDAAKQGMAYARMKDEVTSLIAYTIRAFDKAPKFKRCVIGFHWIEENNRRDIDNVAAGKKFILDALVWAGVITDDSSKYISGFLGDTFEVDPMKPGVWVRMKAA